MTGQPLVQYCILWDTVLGAFGRSLRVANFACTLRSPGQSWYNAKSAYRSEREQATLATLPQTLLGQ